LTIELSKQVATALVLFVAVALASASYLTGVWHAETIQNNIASQHNQHMQIIDTRMKEIENPHSHAKAEKKADDEG
jgi:hypothetical protein